MTIPDYSTRIRLYSRNNFEPQTFYVRENSSSVIEELQECFRRSQDASYDVVGHKLTITPRKCAAISVSFNPPSSNRFKTIIQQDVIESKGQNWSRDTSPVDEQIAPQDIKYFEETLHKILNNQCTDFGRMLPAGKKDKTMLINPRHYYFTSDMAGKDRKLS